jgi:hypothetical protein
MNLSTPSRFPALLPHLVPALQLVREQAGTSLLASMADYATRAATLSHAQAARALNTLCGRLPASGTHAASEVASMLAQPSQADDAAHDRYFHVYRAREPEGIAFLRSIVMAAVLFHAEMDCVYASPEAGRFAAVGGGLTALLGQIAGIRLAPVEYTAPEASAALAEVDPMRRWVLGHQIFAALTQGIIFALQEFEAATRDLDEQRARGALSLAADLMMASATAFRFTADFPPSAYHDVVRPSMMGVDVGEGFSGLLSVDHRRLVAVLVRLRPLMGATALALALEYERLNLALNYVYGDHKFVCARFGGTKAPSLRCPSSSPLPGVEQLDRYQHARVELLRPNTGTNTVIIG